MFQGNGTLPKVTVNIREPETWIQRLVGRIEFEELSKEEGEIQVFQLSRMWIYRFLYSSFLSLRSKLHVEKVGSLWRWQMQLKSWLCQLLPVGTQRKSLNFFETVFHPQNRNSKTYGEQWYRLYHDIWTCTQYVPNRKVASLPFHCPFRSFPGPIRPADPAKPISVTTSSYASRSLLKPFFRASTKCHHLHEAFPSPLAIRGYYFLHTLLATLVCIHPILPGCLLLEILQHMLHLPCQEIGFLRVLVILVLSFQIHNTQPGAEPQNTFRKYLLRDQLKN